jgi:hypothetical protein
MLTMITLITRLDRAPARKFYTTSWGVLSIESDIFCGCEIDSAATARQCAPSQRADCHRIREPSHEPGGILMLIDALSSS